jgi:hypothetical protein
MSRAKTHQLLSEILTLYGGPPALAFGSLVALASGGHVLLSPRGHRYDNLANALAWAFNGILRRLGPASSIDVATIVDGPQPAHVLLVEGLDTARVTRLEAVLRRLRASGEPILVLGTAELHSIPAPRHPDRALWDELFLMRLNGRDGALPDPVLGELGADVLGADQILPEDVAQMCVAVAAIELPAALAAALGRLPRALDDEGWGGLTPRVVQGLGEAAKVVALLRGRRSVHASDVAELLPSVAGSRLTNEELPPRALLDVLDEAWGELARKAAPLRKPGVQRKTLIATPSELAANARRASRSPLLDELAERGTDPLVPPARPAAEPVPAIHAAYYAPQAAYVPPVEDEQHEEDEPEPSPVRRRRRWPSLGARGVSAVLLVTVLVTGAALFPAWPSAARGLGLTVAAEWQLWLGQYAEAERLAEEARSALQSRLGLEGRLEKILFLARRQQDETRRELREREARRALLLGEPEAAAELFESLYRDYPARREYEHKAREARARAAAAAAAVP